MYRLAHAGGVAKRASAVALPALIVIVGLGWPAGARADSLEKELLKQTPAVMRYLQEHNYKNVGVLKFHVKKDGEDPSHSVGPLNMSLANRLEVALVLAADHDAAKQIGVIRGASDVAARLPGASHLSRPGRQILFQARYPLAWGDQEVSADAFLTGVVELSPDRREMNIGILAYGKETDKPDHVVQFSAASDPIVLFEGGESFLLRGAFDEGKTIPASKPVPVAAVVKDAGRVKNQEEKFPLQDPKAPVTVQIFYDGQNVPFEIRAGKAWVPEPREGQKVTIRLKHNGLIQERYAVLLMVNGENTLYKERLSPSLCRKWVVNVGDDCEIPGYKINDNEMETFKVLSQVESKKRALDYGVYAGTIAVAVFREKKWQNPPRAQQTVEEMNEEEDLAALMHAAFPKEPSKNLSVLKDKLRKDAARLPEDDTRGVIVPGEKIGVKIKKVTFVEDPTPLMSATITYWR